ncbi:MAG: DUF362 domain-containing protein [bacterium]|nr:DUF362 domain-containing protein [bacterium]
MCFNIKNSHTTSRRKFLKTGVAAGIGLITGNNLGRNSISAVNQELSRIVIASNSSVRAGAVSFHEGAVEKLLNLAINEYFKTDDTVSAWKNIVSPDDVVGIKINCLAGKGLSTNVELVNAVIRNLLDTGIKPANIIVWDRQNSDLEDGGFEVVTDRDKTKFIGNDTIGFAQDLVIHGSIGSFLSKALTQYCSVIINMPVLKDHGIVGFTGALKNFFGAIHNPNKYHMNLGDPFIADLNTLPVIKNKTRLIIVDALNAQYEGGPPYMPQWKWDYNGIMIGIDPVAVDQTSWQLIENERVKQGLKSLKDEGREPVHIATAAGAGYNLGTNDPEMIEIINI